MQSKREARLLTTYNLAKKSLLPISKRELLLAGLCLYWGEGGKTERGLVSISNTDPNVLRFALYWFIKGLEVPKNKIKILLHLYGDMQKEESIRYWSKTLNISSEQFTKPYIKSSKRTEMDYKGYGHGTCQLRVSNTLLKENILMSIRSIADYVNQYIPEL